MKETKREWMPLYSFYDRTGISRHLEDMAARGWMVEKLGAYSWRYRRAEPKQLRFSVTYFPAASGFDAVQVPLNVFDWSQIENGGMQQLADSGMLVFVRSVFLQGLVFHTPADLDKRMAFCFPYLEKYHALCREFGLAPDQLALSYALSVPGVTTAVMGCDNASQVAANCALFDKTVQLEQAQLEKLRAAFVDIDSRVINPGTWYNA